MTDYKVLPIQKVRLVDMTLAKHIGGKNRPKTIEDTTRRKKKNQAILRKLLIESLNNMKKKLKFICTSKQKNDQNSRKLSRCNKIIYMSGKSFIGVCLGIC